MISRCVLFGLVITVVSLLVTGILLVLPRPFGVQLLGPTWDAARQVVLPTGLAMGAYGVQTAAMLGFRAHGITGAAMRLRLWMFPIPAVTGVAGMFIGGSLGAAYGLLVGAVGTAALLWSALVRLPPQPVKEE